MRRPFTAACLVFLTACAGPKVYIASDYSILGKVAVLPLNNESNDLDGPIFVRQLIQEGLAARGVQVLAPADIDAQLKTQGFTDGGQLRATTPQKIGEWTGADFLLYSTLENFDYINVGVYAVRKVRINSKLVSVKTGERLWEAERDGVTRFIAPNEKEAKRLFATQMAIKFAEKLAHRPLQAESRLAVGRLLSALPNR